MRLAMCMAVGVTVGAGLLAAPRLMAGPPPCPADLDGNGTVSTSDMLLLFGAWATDPVGPPDLDGSGLVGTGDFLLLLAAWGPCSTAFPPCGDPASGNCFQDNGTPGCISLACCETVCAASASCCDTVWDAACRDQALSLCGNCGDAGAGSCCAANGTPGCDDATCCAAVCDTDPYCCTDAWDSFCVQEATKLCTCP